MRFGESPPIVVTNVLDCIIVVNKFELQSRHYIYFQSNILEKGLNLFILQLWVK